MTVPMFCRKGRTGNRISEIPCRVSSNLPLLGAIPSAKPANNGEALLETSRGNPVGSREPACSLTP